MRDSAYHFSRLNVRQHGIASREYGERIKRLEASLKARQPLPLCAKLQLHIALHAPSELVRSLALHAQTVLGARAEEGTICLHPPVALVAQSLDHTVGQSRVKLADLLHHRSEIGDGHRGGEGGRRRSAISHEVDDRVVGLMSDAGNHRNAGCKDGPGQALLIESGKFLRSASSSGE